jgi:putative transposase
LKACLATCASALINQRTDQIDAFKTETSCLTIVWAVMQDIRLSKIPVG